MLGSPGIVPNVVLLLLVGDWSGCDSSSPGVAPSCSEYLDILRLVGGRDDEPGKPRFGGFGGGLNPGKNGDLDDFPLVPNELS